MARRDILNGAKIQEIRRKQKRILQAKIYLGIFAIVALIVGLIFLSRSPKILIDKINISGNRVITNEEIMTLVDEKLNGNYLFLIPKHDVFIFPEHGIEKSILSNFMRISKVRIKRDNFKEITINITERDGKYLWCDELEKCYFTDETGYIFDDAPTFSGSAYLKFYGVFLEPDEKLGQQILAFSEFTRIIKFYENVSAVLNPIKITAIIIEDNGDYKFALENTDGKIMFKKENNFETILGNLDSAVGGEPLKTDLAQKLKDLLYIDLRFNNKVYFKFQE